MRGLRSFVGLLTILVALGAYLYFVESKRTPGDAPETKEKVFAVEADTIDEVTVRAESGDTTTLKKTGTDWQIVAPVTAQPDAAEISGITTNLSTLEQQRVIDENPADLKEYGLAEPRVIVTFKAAGQEQRLLIGGKTPTGSDLYAKTGAQPKVFLIASFLESTFGRTTFDLRDKTALKFDRDAADRLEITTAGSTLSFAKTGGAWQLAEPPGVRSDVAAIEGLVSKLDGLQMKTLSAAAPAELKTYGLDAPSATVRVSSGSSQATLLVGGQKEEGVLYAKDASRPEVFTIEATLLDELKKGAGEYRQKDLFDARGFNTTRVEIVRSETTVVFEKVSGKDKDGRDEVKWRQTAPSAKEADSGKVEGLLASLTSGRADAFVEAAPASATTEAVVTLTFGEGKTERVTFLRAGTDAYAVRDGGTAKIPQTVLDDLLKSLAGVGGGQAP